MSRQQIIFSGNIRVWEDYGEFIAEYSRHDKRYCRRAPSAISALIDLFDEMAKDGLLGSGGGYKHVNFHV